MHCTVRRPRPSERLSSYAASALRVLLYLLLAGLLGHWLAYAVIAPYNGMQGPTTRPAHP